MRKRVIAFVLLLAFMISMMPVNIFAASESESNDTRDAATNIVTNEKVSGNLASSRDVDWYKFTLASNGVIKPVFNHSDLSSSRNYWEIGIYDANGDLVVPSGTWIVSGNGTSATLPEIGLPAGTYYVKIADSNYHSNTTYSFNLNYTSSSLYEKEKNEERAKATAITPDKTYKGSIATSSDVDWYKFTLKNSQKVSMVFSHGIIESASSYWYISLYDGSGNKLLNTSVAGNDTKKVCFVTDLSAGTYYVEVSDYSYHSDKTYQLTVNGNIGWSKDSKGWKYKNTDGSREINKWSLIDSKWYHFDSAGYMQTGWIKDGGSWYYLKSSGEMATGWLKDGSTWYYLKGSGAMAANEYVGGYWLNANGSWTYQHKATWRKSGNRWWYGDPTGWYAKNGTYKIDGVNYSFDAAGWMK